MMTGIKVFCLCVDIHEMFRCQAVLAILNDVNDISKNIYLFQYNVFVIFCKACHTV